LTYLRESKRGEGKKGMKKIERHDSALSFPRIFSILSDETELAFPFTPTDLSYGESKKTSKQYKEERERESHASIHESR